MKEQLLLLAWVFVLFLGVGLLGKVDDGLCAFLIGMAILLSHMWWDE